jgi:hypothetical protein
VYYRVYKIRGAIKSRRPVDSSQPWVGHISVDSIPPPHTAASIMRCISKAEEIDMSEDSQLWNSPSSDSPMGDGHVSILASRRPGATPEDPIAFVEPPVPYSSPVTHVSEPAVATIPTQTVRGPLCSPHSSSHQLFTGQLRVISVSREFDFSTSGNPSYSLAFQRTASKIAVG